MNWSDFKRRYHQELSHIAGFEEKFVDLVLSQIPELSPQDVIPQYHFIDDKGGNRYVDFMIINKNKNWLLPIELDGYAKMVGNGEEYHRFNDFLERQNAMIHRFGLVLRYTNKTMLNQPQTIIKEIYQTLQKQSQDKSTKDIQEQHTKAIIADYEAKIKQLQAKQKTQHKSKADDAHLVAMLDEMKKEIHTLKTSRPAPTVYRVVDDNPKPKSWLFWIVLLMVLLSLGVLAFAVWYVNDHTTNPVVAPVYDSDITKNEITSTQETKQESNPPISTQQIVQETSQASVTSKPKQEPKQESKPEPSPPQTEFKPVAKPLIIPSNEANFKKTQIQEPVSVPDLEPTSEPKQTTDTAQNICGTVVQAKAFNGGVHLNLDNPYPNQTMTLKVWKQTNLDEYVGKRVCSYGKVKEYKGKPYIDVNSLKGIKVQ